MNTYLATLRKGRVILDGNYNLPEESKVLLTILDDINFDMVIPNENLPEGISLLEIKDIKSELNSFPQDPVEFLRKVRDEER